MHDCLHLKSAVTRVDDTNIAHPYELGGYAYISRISTDRNRSIRAVCRKLPACWRSIIFPTDFPKTRAKLEETGFKVVTVDVSELAKAEGAVTCCSLIINKTLKVSPAIHRHAGQGGPANQEEKQSRKP